MPDPGLLGIGMDLEACGALGRLDEVALRRAATRWLTPSERAWCAGQPSLGESMVVVLCCKEAAFKAWHRAGAAHEVRLDIAGSPAGGWARSTHDAVTVGVRWRQWHGQVLALAVALAPEAPPA